MSLLFESIRISDGRLQNLEYHTERLNQSRKELYNSSDWLDLHKSILLPDNCAQGIFKCKVSYREAIESVTFEPYKSRQVETLKLMEVNHISYSYKFADRSSLTQLWDKRETCDDILIVKNGCITDTSFSNIVFFDGSTWFTPSTPLLPGTMRRYLLTSKLIVEKEIPVNELNLYQAARLINAMLPFESGIDLPIKNIRF